MTDVAEYFCQTHNVNIARQSCGDVRVQSYSYYKGEDRGNRFLVSYEGNQPISKAVMSDVVKFCIYCRPVNSKFTTWHMLLL